MQLTGIISETSYAKLLKELKFTYPFVYLFKTVDCLA